MQTDRDKWAAAFRPGEYDKPAWLEAYVSMMGDLRPEMSADEAWRAAFLAWEREGWCDPRVTAGLDALLGPGLESQ